MHNGRVATVYPFRIYAHRGASAEVPENTLEAFRLALELGVDAIETDVHVTRDGHVVVFHDASGARTCGVSAAIADQDLPTLRRWDPGYALTRPDGAQPWVGEGLRVPTLDEALDAFPTTRFNVDIKDHSRRAVRRVLDVVRAHDAAERVLLTSVAERTVKRVRWLGYPGETGLGQAAALRVLFTPTRFLRRRPPPGHALQIPHTLRGHRLDRAWLIDRAHAVGLRVDFWTVNDPALARTLVDGGADGVMTDDPRAIVQPLRTAPP